MKRLWMVVVLIGFGCASASETFVHFPVRGQSSERLKADQGECERIAQEKKQEVQAGATGAAVGGLGGAAMGAVTGAIGGGIGIDTAVGAAVGALVGLFTGLGEDDARYKRIYAACMNARGYTVGG